jgi:uncharacterized protein (TIGR02444 family)
VRRLWDWALEAYGRPGVEAACLRLQDEGGQSVPFLRWALWSAEQGRAPDLLSGAALARAWEEEAVGPLRRLRRALKALDPEPDREAVRDQVKAVELDAERRLLSALERLPPLPGGAPADAETLLVWASEDWGQPLTADAFAPLQRALNAGTG